MLSIPAHGKWSVDRALGWTAKKEETHFVYLWLMRFQIGVVYFFGGVAKINMDWLAGQPFGPRVIHEWLPKLGWIDPPVWTGYLYHYLGLLFDLAIVPLLLFRQTRGFGIFGALVFHGLNAVSFNIDVFPFLAFALSLLFCKPDFPAQVYQRFKRFFYPEKTSKKKRGKGPDRIKRDPSRRGKGVRLPNVAVYGVIVYMMIQSLLPLRHCSIPATLPGTRRDIYSPRE